MIKNLKTSKLTQIKNWIKRNRYSHNWLIRNGIEVIYSIVTFLYAVKGILTNKQDRAIFYMRLFEKKRVHQTTPLTCMNRYPVIFSACKQYFERKKDIRILSFGCSTGEEVLTLRYYFPDATIVGAEINPYSLEICKSRKHDDKIRFIESTSEELQKQAPFDVIFCMAVFQRTPSLIAQKRITNLKKIYPFERFEQQIIELDQYVKEGGLLVVHCSQYYLKDTKVGDHYHPYGEYNQDGYGPYIFDQNSQLIKEPFKRYSIFKKQTNYIDE